MSRYFNRGMTRVVIAPTIANIAAPNVLELAAALDISDSLTGDGLAISHTTTTLDRTPWSGDTTVAAPTRYDTSITLRGYRGTSAAADVFWTTMSAFRTRAFLVVRRGVYNEIGWIAGQAVEVYDIRYGKRSASDTEVGAFEVPLFVQAENDMAEVV